MESPESHARVGSGLADEAGPQMGATPRCQNSALEAAGSHWSLGGREKAYSLVLAALGKRSGQEDMNGKVGEQVGLDITFPLEAGAIGGQFLLPLSPLLPLSLLKKYIFFSRIRQVYRLL